MTLDISVSEVVLFIKEKGFAKGECERVGEAISEIQAGRVAAFALLPQCLSPEMGLFAINRYERDLRLGGSPDFASSFLRQANGQDVARRPVHDHVFGRLDEKGEPMPFMPAKDDEINFAVVGGANDLVLDVAYDDAPVSLRHSELLGEPADLLLRNLDQLGLRRHAVRNDRIRGYGRDGEYRLHHVDDPQLRIECGGERSGALPD
jgi:hypothetical protein